MSRAFGMLVRFEVPADERAIHDLTVVAFEPMPFSDGSEAPIIRALRAAGDLTLSLVAEDGGEIVGHVAVSPARIGAAEEGWYGLGPIAVRPDRQRQGIGSALVKAAAGHLRERGALGVALIGNPAVYRPMGFVSGAVSYRDVDRVLVQHLMLAAVPPHGELRFAPAFDIAG
jgi:putative acetyltransferase